MKYSDKILNYNGLYGEELKNTSAMYLFLEPIATRSQIFDWNIKPHVHKHLYQVFIISKGSLNFIENNRIYALEGPSILLIPPNRLHGLVYSPDVKGQILTLSDKIIEDIFKTSKTIWKTFENIQIFKGDEVVFSFQTIEEILKKINEELFSDFEERWLMLEMYLTHFFIVLHRLNNANSSTLNVPYSTHFRKFKQNILVAQKNKSIPEFAEELNITSIHLNRICKAVSGKTAIELVHEHLIKEAQKYLLHTSYSISEIAYQLGFDYPNYFAKLFKKNIGVSPLEYRKQYNY